MKKRNVLRGVLCFFLLCAAVSFCAGAVCENGNHRVLQWENVTAATCISSGERRGNCADCGEPITEFVAPLAHEYSTEYTVDTPAACTKSGSKSLHCKNCGAIKPDSSVTIPATGHKPGQWKVGVAATCTLGGTDYTTCTVCGEAQTRSAAALGHDTVTTHAIAATCTQDGATEGSYCQRCNEVFKQATVISALGHNMVDEPAKAATCTEDGATAGRHCSRCSYTEIKQQTILKLGHKTVLDAAVPATCTAAGKTEGSHCEVCGTVFYAQVDLPKKPHNYRETQIKKTCTVDGCRQFTCTVCGDTYRKDVDYAQGHVIVVEKATEETCTEDGLSVRTYCSVCGETLEEAHVIPARGHTAKETVLPATRKKDGKITRTCADCGVSLGESVIPKIASVTLGKTKYYCDGKKKTPSITITDAEGQKLIYKKDFTASWDSGRKKPGTYYVTVTFIGNYSGAKTMRFKILMHKTVGVKATPAKGAAKVTWNKTVGAQKYTVYYCTTKNGTYKKAGTTAKTALNVKKLESGKTYYFIVRATATDSAGNTVKNEPSAIRKAKI